MNAIAESITVVRRWHLAERQVFVLMAALFVMLTLAGFVPSSLAKIQAVQDGARPPFPVVLHVHAAVMGAWLLLLLAQSMLASAGNRRLHRVLGLLGAVLLPVIVVSGVLLIDTTWQGLWSPAAQAMPPAVLEETRKFVTNILLLQGRALILFPLFVLGALAVRHRDPASHQRLMLLGTAIPVVAGLDRLATALGLTTLPESPLALDLWMLASVLPLIAWDLLRHRRIHPTTLIWLAVSLPMAGLTMLLWNSPWWLATAPRLIGVI